MGFFDDFSANIQNSIENVKTDINGYIDSRLNDPVVKVGDIQTGNLNPLQLLQGMVGGKQPVAPPATKNPVLIQNSASASQIKPPVLVAGLSVPVLIGIGVAAYFLFSGKSRG